MANVSGIPTGSDLIEVDTHCDSCAIPAVAFPERGLVEQMIFGQPHWGAGTLTQGVIFTWNCLACKFQNDLVDFPIGA